LPVSGVSLQFVKSRWEPVFASRVSLIALEMLLLVLLAVQAARLVWIVVTPGGPYGEAPSISRIDLSPLTVFNPFQPRGESDAAAPDTPFRLYGVRAGVPDETAILAAGDGPQRVYRIGEEIVPGTSLAAVATDHVVLSRGVREFRIDLDLASTTGSAPVVPSYLLNTAPGSSNASAPPSLTAAVDPQTFMNEAGLAPRLSGGEITGYTLLPRAGGETLKSLGLEAGDVIVALNGNRLTPEIYSRLAEGLSAGGNIQLTVERGSNTRTLTLQTGGQE